LISIVPVFSIVLFAASTPTIDDRLSTAGSARIACAVFACRSAIRAYDTSSAASTRARSCPVSCVGKRPFGMTT
jgi:hypothetical protein